MLWFRLAATLATPLGLAIVIASGLHEGSGADLAATGIGYTRHVSNPPRTEMIPLTLAGNLTAADRANIQEAAGQWNRVLNGYVRFEIKSPEPGTSAPVLVPDSNTPAGWVILGLDGSPPAGTHGDPATITIGFSQGGGLIVVYAGRSRSSRFERTMLREFGHVLGLTHTGGDKLMTPTYSSGNQSCIDKATVEKLAEAKRLPLGELNWCIY